MKPQSVYLTAVVAMVLGIAIGAIVSSHSHPS